jgi:hypothetical protein
MIMYFYDFRMSTATISIHSTCLSLDVNSRIFRSVSHDEVYHFLSTNMSFIIYSDQILSILVLHRKLFINRVLHYKETTGFSVFQNLCYKSMIVDCYVLT